MRIIGGKDYYDHGLAHGVDESVVFRRVGRHSRADQFPLALRGGKPSVTNGPRGKAEFEGYSWSRSDSEWELDGLNYSLESVYVYFCGRLYSGARLSVRDRRLGIYNGGLYKLVSRETYWEQNSLGKRLGKLGMVLRQNRKTLLAQRNQSHAPFWRGQPEQQELSALIELGVAVAVLTGDHTQEIPDPRPMAPKHTKRVALWEVNGDGLNDVDFIKVLDPVQAFQQLSMWVGGVLPQPGNPMVQITDDSVKLVKHGMDKWSFRKMGKNSK